MVGFFMMMFETFLVCAEFHRTTLSEHLAHFFFFLESRLSSDKQASLFFPLPGLKKKKKNWSHRIKLSIGHCQENAQ